MNTFEFETALRILTGDRLPGRVVEPNDLHHQSSADAIRTLYPLIERLPQDLLDQDKSLIEEVSKPEEWTQRFLHAAFDGPIAEFDPLHDLETMSWNRLQRNLTERSNCLTRPYSHEVVEARFSLLFPIALSMHEGGEAIYPAYGLFGSAFVYQRDLCFRERLERIALYLQKHKWLVMHVIEEKHTHAFVASPDRWIEARLDMWRRQEQHRDQVGYVGYPEADTVWGREQNRRQGLRNRYRQAETGIPSSETVLEGCESAVQEQSPAEQSSASQMNQREIDHPRVGRLTVRHSSQPSVGHRHLRTRSDSQDSSHDPSD